MPPNGRHLVPDAPVEDPVARLRHRAAPVLEEEGDARDPALLAQPPHPVRIHRAGWVAGAALQLSVPPGQAGEQALLPARARALVHGVLLPRRSAARSSRSTPARAGSPALLGTGAELPARPLQRFRSRHPFGNVIAHPLRVGNDRDRVAAPGPALHPGHPLAGQRMESAVHGDRVTHNVRFG